MPRIITPAIERLKQKTFVSLQIDPVCGTPCHITTAAKTAGKPGEPGRYPVIGVPGRGMVYTHRIAFESAFGELPAGPCPDGSNRYELHHRCENKACVNPHHLQLVTSKEHRAIHAQLRRNEKARKAAQLQLISTTHKAEMDRFFAGSNLPSHGIPPEIVEHDE